MVAAKIPRDIQASDHDLKIVWKAVREGDPSKVREEMERLTTKAARMLHFHRDWSALIGRRPFVKTLSLLSDAEYLLGDFPKARRRAKKASNVICDLMLTTDDKVPDDEECLKLHRQQIWLVTAEAAALIRLAEPDRAREKLTLAERFVQAYLRRPTFRCFGTVARIDYYLGLLARNNGQLGKARRYFDSATEAAIARCDEAVAGTRDRTEQDAERTFKKRCLARLQAFGYGLSALCEGRLLSARASFNFALELLLNPVACADGTPVYHDELMANEISLWLFLVRAMVMSFDPDANGIAQLEEMKERLVLIRNWFSRNQGGFKSQQLLADAVELMLGMRLLQIQCHPKKDGLFERAARPLRLSGHPRPDRRWGTDVTFLITHVIFTRVAVDANPIKAVNINEFLVDNIRIPFWRNEVLLAREEARIEEGASWICGRSKAWPFIRRFMLDRDYKLQQLSQLTKGQTAFAEVSRVRVLSILSGAPDWTRERKMQLNEWRAQAELLIHKLRRCSAVSGILQAKIASLPMRPMPPKLPLPDAVGYDRPFDYQLYNLISGRNALLEFVLRNPGLDLTNQKKFWAAVALSNRMTRARAHDYLAAFADLCAWLQIPQPKPKPTAKRHEHQKNVSEYLKFLESR